MRLLIVAMSDSIHTARWISQISRKGWHISIFPSIDNGIVHPLLDNVHIYNSIYCNSVYKHRNLKQSGLNFINSDLAKLGRLLLKRKLPNYRLFQLVHVIKKFKPDIIHSMEIQHAGYLTLAAQKKIGSEFPPWIVTCWGSDIYLYGRLSEHKPRIKEVVSLCDYYFCESTRDLGLAKNFGFKGDFLPVFPIAGGFDLKLISRLRDSNPVSKRRKIMLKGYQTWAGRALVGLRALERCADVLSEYQVAIYSASPDVVIAAKLFSNSTGIPVTIISNDTPNIDIIKLHGQSRISIGLSISDGVPESFLEALVMGSFPIQSLASSANEWIEDEKTGILVPPEDPEIIEKAIRKALSDDKLVDEAAETNLKTAHERLDFDVLKQKTIDIYEHVYKKTGNARLE